MSSKTDGLRQKHTGVIRQNYAIEEFKGIPLIFLPNALDKFRIALRPIFLICTAELCTATLEMIVAFLDDGEGLDVVPGQIYEVQVRSIEKIMLEGPRAHPFEEIKPHFAHKDQGLVDDLFYLGELPGVKEFKNSSDAARHNHKTPKKQ